MTALPQPAPPPQHCQVIELRQYTLHPGRRERLIELFDRELIETQEAVGLAVIGQFRDRDEPDRFAWLRGFADMSARPIGLQAFYDGPVWAAHRSLANSTMIDSSDVLLLRPAWAGAGLALPAGTRAPLGSHALPAGAVLATVLPLRAAATPELPAELVTDCRQQLQPTLAAAGALLQGWYVSEPAPNNFPRLPVRGCEPVLVAITLCADDAALDRLLDNPSWTHGLAPWLAGPPQHRRWTPTARSALHA